MASGFSRTCRALQLQSSLAEDCMNDLVELYRQRQEGAIGYILLWLMGVPASLLFLVILLRGCD